MPEDNRVNYAIKMFVEKSELIPIEHRQPILDGVILIGMTPFEAKLAGGAFSFRVIPDRLVWPANADPYDVMLAQSVSPDCSSIWMTFKNASQFPERGQTTFRVNFYRGLASEITQV